MSQPRPSLSAPLPTPADPKKKTAQKRDGGFCVKPSSVPQPELSMHVIEVLTKAIHSAARHNPDVQVPPACILWADGDRHRS